ncbi:ABC transporter permease subunit [Streptomyces sp. NPDC051940]|uniref:ABC transporter permease subunit n=1 Tax=Streptomyces sp. NPDC051940 TaxID=3155675 RepID=UPI00343DFADD
MAIDTTSRPASYRSSLPPGRDGFWQLLRAEFTKFRTVRRWLIGLAAAAAVSVALTMLASNTGPGNNQAPDALTGPDGSVVQDRFRFLHQPLTGDGEIVARVASLTAEDHRGPDGKTRGVEGWAKAGVLIKDGAESGAGYAALTATAKHGVRLQWDFTEDRAGSDTAAAGSWLRLVREGGTVTGYESRDGRDWQKVGTVTPASLPRTAEIGLFVASPDSYVVERAFGSLSEGSGPTKATGVFDHVTVNGKAPASGSFTGEPVGELTMGPLPDSAADEQADDERRQAAQDEINDLQGSDSEANGVYTITGSGDIAPDTFAGGDNLTQSLAGSWVALMVFAALGTLFVTAEYKRGMIRTTLTASPRRGRVPVAKAVVVGVVSFAVALPATAAGFSWAQDRMRDNGYLPPVYPHYSLTEGAGLRAVVGTAAMLALVAVLALAAGAFLRHSAGAITGVIMLMLLPLILGSALPLGVTQWLFTFTPVAAFSVQQGGHHYEQIERPCMPENSCYPLPSYGGLGVLALWAAVVLALAVWRLRRRDV